MFFSWWKCVKFVLLYPGSLVSSVMDSTDVKLYLCKTVYSESCYKFCLYIRFKITYDFFNIVSMSFLSSFPEFIHILYFLFLLSCFWDQDLAEPQFHDSVSLGVWALPCFLCLVSVSISWLMAQGDLWLNEAAGTKENRGDAWYNSYSTLLFENWVICVVWNKYIHMCI